MRGEIWMADLNPSRGSEQAGVRPVISIQRASLDRFTTITVVVPLTTNLRRLKVPGCVLIPVGEGSLDRDSVALCFQVAVIDRQRLIQPLGQWPLLAWRKSIGHRNTPSTCSESEREYRPEAIY